MAANREAYNAYLREYYLKDENKKRQATALAERRKDPEWRKKKSAYIAAWARAKRRADPEWHKRLRDKLRADPKKWVIYLAKRRLYLQRRRRQDDAFRLSLQTAGEIRRAIKRKRQQSNRDRPMWWEAVLGYTASDLRQHLERQFTKEMSWENHGKVWEIDHIVPLAKFKVASKFSPDFKTVWGLANLRPLLKHLNAAKGAKWIFA